MQSILWECVLCRTASEAITSSAFSEMVHALGNLRMRSPQTAAILNWKSLFCSSSKRLHVWDLTSYYGMFFLKWCSDASLVVRWCVDKAQCPRPLCFLRQWQLSGRRKDVLTIRGNFAAEFLSAFLLKFFWFCSVVFWKVKGAGFTCCHLSLL